MKKMSCLFAVLALVAASVHATPVLDQSSNGALTPNNGAGWSWISTSGNFGSKFVADKTSIDGAGVYFSDRSKGGYWSIDPNALFTISLLDADSKLLASNSFTQAKGGWNDVFFADVATTIGSSYYVIASANTDGAAVTTYQYLSSTAANPGAYYFNGQGMILNNSGYTVDARIFSNNAAAAVPEPGSIFLLALGAVGLAGVSKRRNKQAQR